MTPAQISRMAKQLQVGADGYRTLLRAVEKAGGGQDSVAQERAVENMRRLQMELDELASYYGRGEFSPEAWILRVRL